MELFINWRQIENLLNTLREHLLSVFRPVASPMHTLTSVQSGETVQLRLCEQEHWT